MIKLLILGLAVFIHCCDSGVLCKDKKEKKICKKIRWRKIKKTTTVPPTTTTKATTTTPVPIPATRKFVPRRPVRRLNTLPGSRLFHPIVNQSVDLCTLPMSSLIYFLKL
ncbi:unnamed protein product [Trichobilharzia szidati]|nr:unnamed protein product [Trichobilharzia szidati]